MNGHSGYVDHKTLTAFSQRKVALYVILLICNFVTMPPVAFEQMFESVIV